MPLIQVRQSAVHGRGVFAARPIRKGRRIIEYTGRRVAWKSIPADVNGTHTFLFGINDGTDVIDPEIGGNEARSRKTMVASLSMPYATSARAKNCLTIINSKWTNRSRARSKLRMHAIVAAQIAGAPCLIQVVNADLPGKDNR